MTILTRAILAFLLVLASSCATEDPESFGDSIDAAAPQRVSTSSASPEGEPVDASMDSIWREQKLIRDAEMRIQVDVVERAIRVAGEIASRHDGLVADTESSQYSDGDRQAAITVRLPSAKFDDAMAEFRNLGNVERERITTQDITKAYADLETRLSVKRATEERLRAILATRTGNLSDLLNAERELARITEEIEQLLGEKRYYDHRVSVSTIQLSLHEEAGRQWTIIEPVQQALDNSMRVLMGSVAAVIYLVVVMLPWLAIGVPAWWFIRRRRRRHRNTVTTPG